MQEPYRHTDPPAAGDRPLSPFEARARIRGQLVTVAIVLVTLALAGAIAGGAGAGCDANRATSGEP